MKQDGEKLMLNRLTATDKREKKLLRNLGNQCERPGQNPFSVHMDMGLDPDVCMIVLIQMSVNLSTGRSPVCCVRGSDTQRTPDRRRIGACAAKVRVAIDGPRGSALPG